MGRNVQLSAVHVYSQRGARGVRGAVFRDIDVRHTTKSSKFVTKQATVNFPSANNL